MNKEKNYWKVDKDIIICVFHIIGMFYSFFSEKVYKNGILVIILIILIDFYLLLMKEEK